MARRVVLGTGPDALRAAAVLATAGHQVTLLQDAPTVSGLRHPELPQSSGRMRTPEDVRDLTEQILGPLVEAPDAGRGVLLGGKIAWQPMRRRDLVGLIPPAKLPAAARGWLDARKGVAETDLVAGGGQEERSYRDWVVRRMGTVAYDVFYKAWAARRWAEDGEKLGVTVARVHHGWTDPGPHQVAGGRYHVALELAEEVITAAGGEVRTGAAVAGLELTDGVVSGVRLADGELVEVEGPLWVARNPGEVVGWLPEAVTSAVRRDAEALPSADLVVTCLKGEVDGLPEELFVLDGEAPFWAVISPYGIKEYALFMSTVPTHQAVEDEAALATRTAAAAGRLGLGEFSADDRRIERVRGHVPTWTVGGHARLHRVINCFAGLGIVAVGRTGTWSAVDPGAEIALAADYRDLDAPDQREVMRQRVDPPIRLDDLDASIRRFVAR